MKRPMLRHAVSLIALLAAAPAPAQDIELAEIVVSALRTAAERLRTGVSVSVVTAEDLERAGDIRLATYLSRLPGVAVAQSGPLGTQASLRIRGAEPRYVAVYVDGVRVDDPTGIATEFDFGALSTADIARVEVLRGSQSALWGGSAVGGVINITTRAATQDGLSQSAGIEVGSNDTLSLRYSLGYRDDRAEFGLTLSHVRTDGFSAYDTLPRTPGLEDDGFNATRLSFSGRYKATDALTLGLSLFTQSSESDYDAYLADDADNRQERSETGARLFAELETGATRHVFEITRYHVDRDYFTPAASSFTGDRLGFGYQGTTELSQAFTLTYGADWMEETATNAALPAGKDSRLAGAWVQGLWAPTEDLDISASLRRDENSDYGGKTSGRLALAWQASPDLTLRGALATGFRAPSLYEQFGDPAWGIAANAAVRPEDSTSLELGADLRMGEGASLGVTVFAIDVDNALTYCGAFSTPCAGVIPVGFTNMYENVPGTSKRRGVELSGDMALGDRASLGLSYTYTDAKGPSGDRLLRVPRHSLSVTLSGDLADRLSGQLGVQHIAGRADEFGTPAEDYTVVNAGMSYALSDAADLSLRVENLLDEDYQVIPGYGTSGRAVYLGLDTRF